MKKIIMLLCFSIAGLANAQTIVKHVDAATFQKYIAENKYELIDLRTDGEILKKGMIKGARQIDYFAKDAETTISKLDRKKTYLIYCAGGGRSGECAELMTRLGFKEVIDLEKGFDDWKRRGLEVVNR